MRHQAIIDLAERLFEHTGDPMLTSAIDTIVQLDGKFGMPEMRYIAIEWVLSTAAAYENLYGTPP